MKYNLVHITTTGEYATPLVASQLFDQAEVQATDKGANAPALVAAWIIAPMRDAFSKVVKNKLDSLRQRCPHVSINTIAGINRLNDFPAIPMGIAKRVLLGPSVPVIYHCRGESAALWALQLKKYFPADKVVLDVRGFWPAELIYKSGIENPEDAKGDHAIAYNKAFDTLENVIAKADAVTTVSEELRYLLINKLGASSATTVVPCCVKEITADTHRNSIREKWSIASHEIAIVYSGTAAVYQHLEDLTLPFLHALSKINKRIRVVVLTPDIDTIKDMLAVYHFEKPVIIQSVQQKEVAKHLTAADIGILIRKPTLVNTVANPVKIAEYLSAGLSIIAEKGVGGIPAEAFESEIIKGVELSPGNRFQQEAAAINDWIESISSQKRVVARSFAQKYYDWNTAIHIHRDTYSRLIKTNSANN